MSNLDHLAQRLPELIPKARQLAIRVRADQVPSEQEELDLQTTLKRFLDRRVRLRASCRSEASELLPLECSRRRPRYLALRAVQEVEKASLQVVGEGPEAV